METKDEIRNIPVAVQCRQCKQEFNIMVSAEGIERRNNGEKVQDAFPYLKASEREMFTWSRMCGKCYAQMCGEEDEGDLEESDYEQQPESLESFFDTIISIDPGDLVICDLCNEAYNGENKATKGLLFAGSAICPNCEPRTRKNIAKYGEQAFITDPNEGETFHDFIIRMRHDPPNNRRATTV